MTPDSTRTLRSFGPNEILAGRFSIVRCIGTGGMGAVYEAFDLELSRSVAVKLIHPEISADPLTLDRFKSEIKLGREVSHANLCRLYDFGVHHPGGDAPDIVFLTMELLDGITLAERLHSGPLSTAEALPIARQIACGLDALHEASIVHRDLKPANILLSTTRSSHSLRVVITDFGLARDTAPGSGLQTGVGHISGTPRYMAPEQILGLPTTPATDIYSFGLILYELISGQRAFGHTNDYQSARARVSQLPPAPRTVIPTIEPCWDSAILRALEPEPGDRFPNAMALVDSCQGFVSDHSPRARPSFLGRHKKLAAILASAALILIGALLLVPPLLRHHPPPDAQAAYDRGVTALSNGAYYSAMVSLADAVARDPQFLLAHSRRAEAASRLQFMDEAQSEIASAIPPFQSSWLLKRADLTRIRAIQATIQRRWPEAIASYRSLANSASDNEKPEALSDLAEAYQQSGDSKQAQALYAQALSLDPSYAPALLRTGILLSNAGKTSEAIEAFHRAEALYRAPSDAEARTEVLYQEGRALAASSDQSNRDRAREILTTALAAASSPMTDDPFQKVTILLQLSLLSYRDEDTAAGAKLAQEAMDTARAHSIEVLATSALVDVGNTLFLQGSTDRAGAYYREALSAAGNHSVPYVQARAAIQLSQILLREGRATEALNYATQASDFYKLAGRKPGIIIATTLSARAQRDLGRNDAALASFKTALDAAKAINSREFAGDAEAGIASVLRIQELLPAALEHYEAASTYFDQGDSLSLANNAMNRAELQSELGNEAAANSLVDFVHHSAPYAHDIVLAAKMDLVSAQLALIDLRLPQADQLAASAAVAINGQDLGTEIGASLIRCQASSIRYCAEARSLAAKTEDRSVQDSVRLTSALAELAAGNNESARQTAAALLAAIPPDRLPETSLIASCIAVRASRLLSDAALHDRYQQRMRDSLQNLGKAWGAASSENFLHRPDIRAVCDPS